MSFHLLGWKDTAGSAAQIDMTPIPDGIIPITNAHFLPGMDLQIIAGYVSGAHMGRARFNSGTLRQINPTYIRPISLALLPPTDPNILSAIRAPIQLKGQEEFLLEATQSANTAEVSYGLAWLQDTMTPPAVGTPFTIRATSTSTATAKLWSLISYTLESALPAGSYQMIWSECFSTTGVAHRWTFDNQFLRPGHLSFASNDLRSYRELYQGQFGAMGVFPVFSLPRFEVLCNAADSSFEIYMTVVRVGP